MTIIEEIEAFAREIDISFYPRAVSGNQLWRVTLDGKDLPAGLGRTLSEALANVRIEYGMKALETS
jgi:hypothetical protein